MTDALIERLERARRLGAKDCIAAIAALKDRDG